MYCITLQASTAEDDPDKAYGKPYVFRYWTLDKCLMLVSDSPFKRGDLVDVNPTSDSSIFMLDRVDTDELTSDDLSSLGLLIPLSTVIPLSSDVDYEFSVRGGKVNILTKLKIVDDDNGSVFYLLLVLTNSRKCIIQADDSTHGDSFEWVISNIGDMHHITSAMNRIKNNVTSK